MKNFLKEVLKTTLSTYFASVVTGVGGVSSLIALFHDVSGYYVIYLCALLLFPVSYTHLSLLMSVCTLTLTTQAQSLSDVTNINVDECYIYDSFLSADWGNESMAPGNGSTANDYWAKSWITGTRKVYKGEMCIRDR